MKFADVPFSRREALWLLVLMLAVFASRLPFIMHGMDEWDASNFALSVVRFDVMFHQPHPPGQIVYVRLMQLLNVLCGGNELFTLSFASAVASSLALVPYYFALRQMFRPAIALGATALCAFTFGYWITGLRMVSDPVATLFVYATVCALLAGVTGRNWFLLGMALCGVTLGVKQTSVYFLAPFAIAVNLVVLYRTGVRRPLLGSAIFAAVVAAWLLPTVSNCHGWAPYLNACRILQHENYANESLIFHLYPAQIHSQWHQNMIQPWGMFPLAVLMLLLALPGLVLCLRRGLAGMLWALFSVTVVFYAFFFLNHFNKYYVYYVPIYCASAAVTLGALAEMLARRLDRPVLATVVPAGAIALITLTNFGLTLPLLPAISHFRTPSQAAIEALKKMPGIEQTPLVLTDDVVIAHALRYFDLKKKLDLLNDRPNLRDAAKALSDGRKLYFLSSVVYDPVLNPPTPAMRLLGRYDWKPRLYDMLEGRPELKELSLYEVTASLPKTYRFNEPDTPLHLPLIQKGMWIDGWLGLENSLVLPCDERGAELVHLRITAEENSAFHYPYELVCRLAGGEQTALNLEHSGPSDFVIPVPTHAAVHATEMSLFAPQTYRRIDRDPRTMDERNVSVHLDELECVTESEPLIVRRESGWFYEEVEGGVASRWTDGKATLSVLTDRAGNLNFEAEISSVTADNAVEILVDGRTAQTIPLSQDIWTPVTMRLPVTAGYHWLTLRSRNPAVRPPKDSRALALRVRNCLIHVEP